MNAELFRGSVVAAVATLSSAASADVIFSNWGPNNSYLGNAGWSVANGGPFGVHLEEAVSFTPAAGYFLDSVEIAIGLLFGPNYLEMRLHSDAGGAGAPGAVLETRTIHDQMLPMPNKPEINNPPVVIPFSGTTALQPGVRYWLSVSTDATTDSWAAWNENITGDVGLRGFRENGGAWSTHTGHPRGTFRINATPVPGPGSVGAVVLGGLVARRRRR